MDKTKKIEGLVSRAGKAAKSLLNGAAQSMDKNDDGKFDIEDVAVIADAMGDTIKRGAQVVKENAEEKMRSHELKVLRPVFTDYLDSAEFLLPKFIRIVDRDKKYKESIVCQGSIGYESDSKGFYYLNIFRDSIEVFGLAFYPDSDFDFYYVDPSERDRYIALDEYFGYLKIARVNELKRIAQDLGAKYFKVTYKEEQSSFSNRNAKVYGDVAPVKVDGRHEWSQKKYSTIDVAAEMSFPGHLPVKPQLKYLQRDPSIQTLISMRLDESAPLLKEKFMLKMSNSSGMKESDAVKIDGVLKELKFSGNTTVTIEAKNESRRYFEYDIEF